MSVCFFAFLFGAPMSKLRQKIPKTLHLCPIEKTVYTPSRRPESFFGPGSPCGAQKARGRKFRSPYAAPKTGTGEIIALFDGKSPKKGPYFGQKSRDRKRDLKTGPQGA